MKKNLFLIIACVTLMVSCNESSKSSSSASALEDSLQNIIDQKDQDLNELMGTLAEIQEGFALINEAEGRVNALNQSPEGGSATANIQENLLFIEQTMEQNRKKIEDLQSKLKQSGANAAKLKAVVDQLTEQLSLKSKEIDELRAQLAERDIRIDQLDQAVSQLKDENSQMQEVNDNNEQILRNQDAQLNTAWYVYGTARELKDHKILDSGDVLQNKDFDKEYFTKIDIRKTTVINFGSKSAKILTTHPENSYSLLKDSKGEYTLRITDAYKFWSVSKYLVVKVK